MKQRSKFDRCPPAALMFCDDLARVCHGSFRAPCQAQKWLWLTAVHTRSFPQPPLLAALMINCTFGDRVPRNAPTSAGTIQSP